jgi:microtubule-associated protein-like 6
LFHNINNSNLRASAQNPHARSVKDVQWQTQTCILGWSVQGIFDGQQDGTDVNNCDRSPDGKLLVTGDDYGYVNLFRYPVVMQGNARRIKVGHSSHVMNCKFLSDGSYVITAGGNDKCILQWRVSAGGSSSYGY